MNTATVNSARLLSTLYDLALVVGAEVQLVPLLTRTLQRLLYHTSFPAGVALLGVSPAGETRTGRLQAAVGNADLARRQGEELSLPARLVNGPPALIDDTTALASLPCQPGRYNVALRLPFGTDGVLLLLAPSTPQGDLPLTELFQPVMANLARAVMLCRHHEAYTQDLVSDRDQARAELARELRHLEEERTLLRTLYNALPDPIWLKDGEGRYLACNRAFELVVGQREPALVGRTDTELFVPEITRRLSHADREAVTAGRIAMEEWLTYPDGRSAQFEIIKLAVRHTDGTLIGVLGVARDMTERLRAEAALREAKSRFDNFLRHSPDYMWSVRPDFSGFHFMSPAGERIYERPLAELAANPNHWLGVVDPADLPDVETALATLYREGYAEGEYRVRLPDGRSKWLFDRVWLVYDESGKTVSIDGIGSDITIVKEHRRRLEQMAHFDPLTRLPNRSLLAERMREGLARTRSRQQLLAVCYLDLDGFKPVNDLYGHEAGDRLLALVAERLKRCVRDGDTVARLGGDEFVLLLAGLGTAHECGNALERVLRALAEPLTLGSGEQVRISGSIGATLYPLDDADADTLLRHADLAMYEAKQAGRNRYFLFDPERDRQIHVRQTALQRIEQALTGGELRLYYQPKVDMRRGKVTGAEALLRWQHPERGLLPPAEFLPLVEQSELDPRIGEWVIGEALRQMAAWRAQGLDIAVSVNLSGQHLQQPGFPERLAGLLEPYGAMAAGRLEIEMLESTALEEIGMVRHVIEACSRLGVSFALDDFGTGYSSLTYLRRLPASVLKIDQTFVRDMLKDPEDLAIVEGVIGLSHAFRRTVIAEGVETVEHGAVLLRLGCDLAQGYGIARPMPPEALPAWAADWTPHPSWCEAGAGAEAGAVAI